MTIKARAFAILPLLVVTLGLQWLPNIWLVVVPYHALCLALPRLEKYEMKHSGMLKFRKGGLAGPVLVALITIALGWIVGRSELLDLLPSLNDLTRRLYPQNLYFIYSLLVNPLCEEWFWRGFIADRLGTVESAAWFSLTHLLALMFFFPPHLSAVLILPVFVSALFWSYLRRATGSLRASVITHAAADLAIFIAVGIPTI